MLLANGDPQYHRTNAGGEQLKLWLKALTTATREQGTKIYMYVHVVSDICHNDWFDSYI